MGALGLMLGVGGVGYAASPASGSVGPGDASAGWTGKTFSVGATATGAACPASVDAGDALCDHFSLHVSVDASYWKTHEGGVTVSISWPDAADNFDLYIFDGSGGLAATALSVNTKSERAFVPSASGSYEVRVVPVAVLDSGYTGTASFSSEELPPPEGGGGSGGGGGDGGGGSGGGGGGSGGGSGGGGGGGKGGQPFSFTGSTYRVPSYQLRSFDTRLVFQPPVQEPGATGAATTSEYDVVMEQPAQAAPESATVTAVPVSGAAGPRVPEVAWVLLPIGILALAVAWLAVFEPVEAPPVTGAARPAPSERPLAPGSLARSAFRAFRRRIRRRRGRR